MALYFAARGEGRVDGQSYNSTARILLSGLGADEVCHTILEPLRTVVKLFTKLFGGYSRHRRAFQSTSGDAAWTALASEMQMDLQRIGMLYFCKSRVRST